MHVTLIVPAPFDTVSGGYGYDRRIVAELRARGHEVAVTELPGRYPVPDDIARDAACTTLERMGHGTKTVIDGLALPAFAGLGDAFASFGVVGLLHHPTSLEAGLSEPDRQLLHDTEQLLFRRLRRSIVTSEPTADGLVKDFGLRRDTVSVVLPGTDDAPRSKGSQSPTVHILSIGTLIPRKGHDLLLRALARLFDLDWRVTIVGGDTADPAHAAMLKSLAAELGIADRTTFAGTVVGLALEALWQSHDLFALATQHEGYGMVVAESLKRGLPTVVTDGGAAGSLLADGAGLVCPVGDRDQLSKTLRRLIFSADLRHDYADAAWRAGQSLPTWADQAALFAEALAN